MGRIVKSFVFGYCSGVPQICSAFPTQTVVFLVPSYRFHFDSWISRCCQVEADLAPQLPSCCLSLTYSTEHCQILVRCLTLKTHFHYLSLPTSTYLIADTYKAMGDAEGQKERFSSQDLFEAWAQWPLYTHLKYSQESLRQSHSMNFIMHLTDQTLPLHQA